MKNLKRTLALVLAFVLCIGCFGIVASATNLDGFTDKDKVGAAYVEAADLFVGLGIVNGINDTILDPQGTYTREQAASLVTRIALGTTVSSKLTCNSDPFKDVKASRWSAGSIAYCVGENYIAGLGNGNFDPEGVLTGYGWAKLLLVALGYDGNEYLGNQWQINVAKDGFTAGLFKGDESMATDKAITREQAMLMAFNAFFYGKEVTKNTTLYLVSAAAGSNKPTNIIGNTYATTADAIAAAVADNSSAVLGVDYTLTPISGTITTVENSLAKTVYGVTKASSTDASGRTTTQYLDKNGKVISTTAINSTLSYTTPVKSNDLYNALGLTTGTTGTIANVKTNGSADSTFTIARNSNAVIGGNGVLTEVYRNGANVSIVVTQPTFGKVTNIATGKEANGSVYSLYTIGTGSSFGTTATYKLYTSALNNEENTIVLKGNVAKGDYITVSVVGGVATVAPATMVTGKLTAYSSATNTYTIEGKGYQLSGATGAAAPTSYNSTTTFAVDSYGYLLGAVTVTVPTNYVYLMKDEESYVLNGTALVKSIVGTILTTDGKVEKVALDKTTTGTAAGLYSYTVNTKGAYVLTPVSADVNASLAPTNPAVASGKYANAATKFIIANWTKDETGTPVFAGTVNVITGYANISALTGVDGSYIDANNDGIAEVVFIEKSSVAATATNYVYYLGTKSTTDGSTWVYDVVVKGAVGTVTGTEGFVAAGMYSINASNQATATTFNTPFTSLGTDATYTNKTVENKGGLLYVDSTYIAPVASNVPVYTITAATGTATVGTAADLANAVTGNVIVCSSSTAITAIYVIA